MHENSELTNHDRFAIVFRERGFRKLSTAQIGKLLQEEYPNFSLGSILPNDHARGNAASCWCVGTPQQIFNKVRRGSYRVRRISVKVEAVPSAVMPFAALALTKLNYNACRFSGE